MGDVVNTHDQLRHAGGGVALLRAQGGSRQTYFRGWQVYRVDAAGQALVTDPKAHWSDHGRKVFSCSWATREEGARAAQAWVAERYGIAGPWARNAFGDYVPLDVQKAFPIRRTKA